MKKKLFLAIGIVSFAVVIAFNINANFSNNVEQNLALANVEALAQGEYIEIGVPCYDCNSWFCIWIWSDGSYDYMANVRAMGS